MAHLRSWERPVGLGPRTRQGKLEGQGRVRDVGRSGLCGALQSTGGERVRVPSHGAWSRWTFLKQSDWHDQLCVLRSPPQLWCLPRKLGLLARRKLQALSDHPHCLQGTQGAVGAASPAELPGPESQPVGGSRREAEPIGMQRTLSGSRVSRTGASSVSSSCEQGLQHTAQRAPAGKGDWTGGSFSHGSHKALEAPGGVAEPA